MTETLKLVDAFAKQFQLIIGSVGFSETGELEKVYLFKSRANRPANSHSTHTRGEASANIDSLPSVFMREWFEKRRGKRLMPTPMSNINIKSL